MWRKTKNQRLFIVFFENCRFIFKKHPGFKPLPFNVAIN